MPRRPLRRPVPGAALVILLSACGGSARRNDPASVPEWPSALDLRVGSVDGPVTLTRFPLMAVGPNGRMYTLHPTEQQVRVFAPDGSLAGTIGGRGGGPAEFGNAGALGWVADTLWVLDFRGYDFKEFSADGDLLATFSVPFAVDNARDVQRPPRANGLLSDGTVYGAPQAPSHLIASGAITHHRPVLMTRDGRVTDTLPAIPFGRRLWTITDPESPESDLTFTRQPFGDQPLWAFVPGERALVVLDREAAASAPAAAYRVTKLALTGDTMFSKTYPYAPRALSAATADSVLDGEARGLARFRSETEATLREWAAATLYRPAFLTPVTAMVLAEDGEIWLREQPVDSTATWLILSPAGEPEGRTSLPARFTAMVADGSLVYGSETDDLDVPYLVRYRVQRGG